MWKKEEKCIIWKIIKRTCRNAHRHIQNSLTTQNFFLLKFGKILNISIKIYYISVKIWQKLLCWCKNSPKIAQLQKCENLQKITKMKKFANLWKNCKPLYNEVRNVRVIWKMRNGSSQIIKIYFSVRFLEEKFLIKKELPINNMPIVNKNLNLKRVNLRSKYLKWSKFFDTTFL